jgi:hypothetical protein
MTLERFEIGNTIVSVAGLMHIDYRLHLIENGRGKSACSAFHQIRKQTAKFSLVCSGILRRALSGPRTLDLVRVPGIAAWSVLNRDPLIGREGLDRQWPLNRPIPEFFSPPNGLLGRSTID